MNNNKIETTLIQIIPEYLNLKNYNPDKINEQTITIRNNCNIPLLLFLSSSDTNILLLKDSSIKIGKKQKKTISFTIKDKNYSKNKKIAGKPKKVYIFIKNDLIEEKFEISLSYYNCDNLVFSENKSGNNKFINFNSQKQNRFNSQENKIKKIIPKNIQKVNLNKIIKNDMNLRNNNKLNNFNFNIYDDQRLTETEYINNAVQDLRKQILYLKQMLEHSQMKIQNLQKQKDYYFNELIEENCVSFYIYGNENNFNIIYNKNDGFDKSQKDIYEYQNILLKDENLKLNKRVNYLEKKLFSYEQDFRNQNNNYNRNKNFIINNYNYN